MTQAPRPGPRISAKALILRNDRLLVIRCEDAQGPWYLLPGGGQERYEPLGAALRRECREEVNVEVIVHGPVLIRDYIGRNHEFAHEDGLFHQVEVMFLCELPPGVEPALGANPDKTQSATVWLPVAELAHHRLYPRALAQVVPEIARRLAAGDRELPAQYLGDVN